MDAFVLAGGSSRRMGEAKYAVDFGGRRLLDRVFSACSKAFDSVRIVCNPAVDIGDDYPVINERPHDEPAAIYGVAAALGATRSERCWIIGNDFPLVTGEVLSFLRDRAERAEASLVVPSWHGHPQMLCASYSVTLLRLIEERIGMRAYKLRELVGLCSVDEVAEVEIRRFGAEVLTSANTPDELERLKRLLHDV